MDKRMLIASLMLLSIFLAYYTVFDVYFIYKLLLCCSFTIASTLRERSLLNLVRVALVFYIF